MSGQQGFNPGAFEFRPGQQQPFVPRNQTPNGQQQLPYDPYDGQYGQQYQPQYGQYGQQYPQYPQQGQSQYQYQPPQPPPPQQQAFVPGQRQTYVPPQIRNVQGFQPANLPDPTPTESTKTSAPAGGKPLSLNIGAPKAAPSFSIGAPKPAPSLSIGGSSKPVSLSIGKKKVEEKKVVEKEEEEKVPEVAKASPATSDTFEEKASIDSRPTTVPAPTPTSQQILKEDLITTPAPQPPVTDAQVKTIKSSGTSTPTNFTKVSAKNDADAILKEQAAAGTEAMRDLYGDDAKDTNAKGHLNIIFTGHVDAGKSTMGGQMLYLTGAVDKRTMEKYEQEAKAAGRDTWYLSWALDSGKEERAKGKTVEVGRAYFETENRRYTILDAPGHKTYVPSMITGAAQADVALLVLSARKGEFETGFERDGQTREHAVLIKNNGINKLVVVVNKMDDTTVQWDKGRYDEICQKITPFLRSIGFNPKTDLTFIPVSAQVGENMKDKVSKDIAPWYDGPSLLGYLDSMTIMDRNINAPFMLPISEKYNEMGTMVMGKIESGRVKKGDSLLLMPNRSTVEIAAIYTEQAEELEMAFCGDNIRLRLRGISDEDVSPGFVLTSTQKPVNAVTAFKADLSIIETKNIICSGYSCVLHVHTLAEEVTLSALLHYYDKKTKRKSKKPPQFAKVGMLVSAIIETNAPICIEKWEDYKMLGRFTLRDEGE
ncbi:translation elongation factor Tu [Tremella mesenterica]|uniref:Eukaryotic peptide chain release factor GTP-binding subunit n=1 Tax=Tremella mesenterica TaxID=5217 RepID=A0A4Q1BIM1_TREME|nr:translation elongation factor Tu [Tremella mesenterica]